MKVKMILPALTEASSPFFRPIKYSLFPPLGLATLAAYLGGDDEVRIVDEHVEALDLDDRPDLVVIQVYITSAYRSYRIADHYRRRGTCVALGGLHVTSRPAEAPAKGELKYRKYFTAELTPEEYEIGYGAMKNMFMVFCDGDIIEGCHFFSAMLMGESATKIAGHGPHKHRDPEVLVALGTDPDHPHELGAEYEIFMGPEMEKHVVSRPSLVFIPGNLIHCPFRVTRVTRPFIFIEAQYSPKDVETSFRNMVPADMRNKYIWIDSDGSSEKGKPRPQRKMPPALSR